MDHSATYSVAVVGGGAAGLIAAVEAAERAVEFGIDVDVALYERDDRVGRTILATGNGRCNFSNAEIDAERYFNGDFVDEALWALAAAQLSDYREMPDHGPGLSSDPVHDFFYTHGLMWHEDAEGRHYPSPNKASAVVDVLRAAAARAGVHEECGCEVVEIELPRALGKPFTLRMADGAFQRADRVIVATGGHALDRLKVANLLPSRTRPVLGPLSTEEDYVAELDNIRVSCKVTLMRTCLGVDAEVAGESGELLFRKYGVSGICVFDLSRFAWPGDVLLVDFLQVGDDSDVKWFLRHRRAMLERRFGAELTFGDLLRGLVLPRVADVILKRCSLKASDLYEPGKMHKVAEMLSAFPLTVKGIADPQRCQVRRGGYGVELVDERTMGVMRVPGLYLVGEALDVDGPCGGYNLHWAWASGLLAGRSALDSLRLQD